MPIVKCDIDGEPGVKWGDSGKCYTYNPNDKASIDKAVSKATLQGVAARASGYKEGSEKGHMKERILMALMEDIEGIIDMADSVDHAALVEILKSTHERYVTICYPEPEQQTPSTGSDYSDRLNQARKYVDSKGYKA